MKKETEKKKEQSPKVYDFRKVMFEYEFEKFRETDLSKDLGNLIHKNTNDLGTDEIAREIYRTGKAELTPGFVEGLINLLKQPVGDMMASAKVAIIRMLNDKNE